MEQEQIKYIDIMNLGFTVETIEDKVYFDEYGFEFAIISLWLTETVYLDWCKQTRQCTMYRIDNRETMNIKAHKPLNNINEIIDIIKFFGD